MDNGERILRGRFSSNSGPLEQTDWSGKSNKTQENYCSKISLKLEEETYQQYWNQRWQRNKTRKDQMVAIGGLCCQAWTVLRKGSCRARGGHLGQVSTNNPAGSWIGIYGTGVLFVTGSKIARNEGTEGCQLVSRKVCVLSHSSRTRQVLGWVIRYACIWGLTIALGTPRSTGVIGQERWPVRSKRDSVLLQKWWHYFCPRSLLLEKKYIHFSKANIFSTFKTQIWKSMCNYKIMLYFSNPIVPTWKINPQINCNNVSYRLLSDTETLIFLK